jgi:putative PIN family toxin of toxin-antitoxin system
LTDDIACNIINWVLLVLDTDVIVAALRSPNGASRWLLSRVLRREIAVAVSVPLLLEYEAVLNRPEHLAATRLSGEEIGVVLDAVAAVAKQVRFSFRWRPLLPDANDDMVLETAINGGASWIVTFNVRDFGTVGEPFGCRAIRPREVIPKIRTRQKKRGQE